jgi:hypothetical protein
MGSRDARPPFLSEIAVPTIILLAVLFVPLTAMAQTAMPVPKTGSCPGGYYESGGYCAPMRRDAPAAIMKGKGQCPSGWRSEAYYCVQMSKPGR